jgi:ADP-heptose:LPS heptosyltransferase
MILRRHVLIFHQAALGDFVVTWPLALALGRMFPQSRISYVTAGSKGALASRVLGVEAIDVEAGWHLLHSENAELPEPLRKTLSGAHTIVSFVSDPHDAWEHNVRRIVPDSILIQLKTNPPATMAVADIDEVPDGLADHVTGLMLRQLRPWKPVQAGVRQMLRSVLDRGIAYRRAPSGAVVIHPGAGKPEKCWPVERFLALAERLKKSGREVRVLLGEAELEKWPSASLEKIARVADVRKPATYLDLLDEIAQASHFVGNDSGPGHLAGMLGVPTVSLFGTASPRWRPIGPAVKVIEKSSLTEIELDDVINALE